MSFQVTPKGNTDIPDSQLILPIDAQRIAEELNEALGRSAYTVEEWIDKNKDESINYTDERRILQIMPGFQNAAQLKDDQIASPGHWDVSNPTAVQWIKTLNVTLPTTGGTNDGGLGGAFDQAAANSLSQSQKIDFIYNWVKKQK